MKDSTSWQGAESSLDVSSVDGRFRNPFDVWSRGLVHHKFARLARGKLTIIEDGRRTVFGSAAPGELEATVRVHKLESYRHVAFGGSVGAGRAYVEGLWASDDLPNVLRLFALNAEALFGLEGGLARLSRPAALATHWLRRNTRRGSRRNIAAHYDLGNDFYRLFLDDTLTYSCGIFESEGASMRDASLAKYERICGKLDLRPEDHILEIGTGWGGFAIHAASRYGCRVTTTTISREQQRLARKRIAEAGLSERIEVLLKDYRDLGGQYDKIVSIEMIEAVGHQFYDRFFAQCSARLRPNGKMLLQAITMADQNYESHLKDVDFIKHYVFPGSTIPAVTALLQSMTRASDLRLFHLEDITSHYVKTLEKWREAFLESVEQVRELGFSDSFIRTWDYYLAYCEAGFAERYLGDVQMVLVKSGFRVTGS